MVRNIRKALFCLGCTGIINIVFGITALLMGIKADISSLFSLSGGIVMLGFWALIVCRHFFENTFPTITDICKPKRIYRHGNETIQLYAFDGMSDTLLYRVWQVFPNIGLSCDLLAFKPSKDGEKLPEFFAIHPKDQSIIPLTWDHVRQLQACQRFANSFLGNGIMDDDFMAIIAEGQVEPKDHCLSSLTAATKAQKTPQNSL